MSWTVVNFSVVFLSNKTIHVNELHKYALKDSNITDVFKGIWDYYQAWNSFIMHMFLSYNCKIETTVL